MKSFQTVISTGGGVPGGANAQVQFNDGGSFGGDANLVWDKVNDRLSLPEIRALDANGLKLYDDAGNGLFIEDGGQVGIGEAAPAATLDINGTLLLQSGTSINEISIDGTLADNSDDATPTEKAVKTYIDTNAVLHSDFTAADGFMRKTGAGAYEAIKANMSAAVAPTVNDDTGDGYAIASRWLDTTADKEYICLDATLTAAVWIETTKQGGTPGGADTQIQFNDGGSFGGDASLVWDKVNDRLSLPEIRALDVNGLKLYDDAGNGIFIEDGGDVHTSGNVYIEEESKIIGSDTANDTSIWFHGGNRLILTGGEGREGMEIGRDYNLGGTVVDFNHQRSDKVDVLMRSNLDTISPDTFSFFFDSSTGNFGLGTVTDSTDPNTLPKARLHVRGDGTIAALFDNGPVGIGTVSPTAELEVVGDIVSKGTKWTSRTSAVEVNEWYSVTYGNGLFVAISRNGTNRVMTSSDGINWTARTSAVETNEWNSVTYGNGLFVAVATSGTNRVMTSPDGINWTARTSAVETNGWASVTYGNGLFVAISRNGTNRVMTSPDGITWTARVSAVEDSGWVSVTYGNGLFVAVASTATVHTDKIMTSPDGITWTARVSLNEMQSWSSVTYGNGLFVAVSSGGDTASAMTSPDGITWTARALPTTNHWQSVTYGNGLFVAVEYGHGIRVLTSPDGITWTARVAGIGWYRSVTYGNGSFVAVASFGTNRVLTSGKSETNIISHNNIYQGGMNIMGGDVGIGTVSPSTALHVLGTLTLEDAHGKTGLLEYASFGVGNGWFNAKAGGTNDVIFNVSDLYNTIFRVGTSNHASSFRDDLTIGGDVEVSGKAGMGMTNPTAQLHAKGNLSTALTGTVSVTITTTAVTGVGTAFTTELNVGDSIKIANEVFTVSAIADGTHLTIDSAHSAGASAVTAYTDPNLFALDNGDAVSKMVVDKSGNVGIGTTSPTQKLEISAGNLRIAPSDRWENPLVIMEEVGGDTAVKIQVSGASENSLVLNNNNATTVKISGNGLSYFNGGNVGIGVTAPTRPLEVSGDGIHFTPQLAVPTTATEGDAYFDSVTHKLKVYNGTIWEDCN